MIDISSGASVTHIPWCMHALWIRL